MVPFKPAATLNRLVFVCVMFNVASAQYDYGGQEYDVDACPGLLIGLYVYMYMA